jgi:prevent-host-death family protein
MKVNILEAKNRLSELIRTVQSGEEVVIANRGEPVARLVPAQRATAQPIAPGSAAAVLDWLGRHPLPAYARRSVAEIDAAIEAERTGWD